MIVPFKNIRQMQQTRQEEVQSQDGALCNGRPTKVPVGPLSRRVRPTKGLPKRDGRRGRGHVCFATGPWGSPP